MMILGPLVAPRISTVTEALSSVLASEVIFSPSTTRTTGRVTDSPTAVAIVSISMTSPTATFCCLAPARTIAYTAVSSVVCEVVGVRWAPRVNGTDPRVTAQNAPLPPGGDERVAQRRTPVQHLPARTPPQHDAGVEQHPQVVADGAQWQRGQDGQLAGRARLVQEAEQPGP